MRPDEVMARVEKMDPAELSKLLCDALDAAGIKYIVGKANINFAGLSVEEVTDE